MNHPSHIVTDHAGVVTKVTLLNPVKVEGG